MTAHSQKTRVLSQRTRKPARPLLQSWWNSFTDSVSSAFDRLRNTATSVQDSLQPDPVHSKSEVSEGPNIQAGETPLADFSSTAQRTDSSSFFSAISTIIKTGV